MSKSSPLPPFTPKMLENLRKAANDGDVETQYRLGMFYLNGTGDDKNLEEAEKFFRLAAKQGDEKAQFGLLSLGSRYETGKEVVENLPKAVELYREVADQGNAWAQANLGFCYDTGKGVEKNPAEAARFYQLAADQGDARAQYNLGLFYLNERNGVWKDTTKGILLVCQAANQGFTIAKSLLNLGGRDRGKLDIDKKYKNNSKLNKSEIIEIITAMSEGSRIKNKNSKLIGEIVEISLKKTTPEEMMTLKDLNEIQEILAEKGGGNSESYRMIEGFKKKMIEGSKQKGEPSTSPAITAIINPVQENSSHKENPLHSGGGRK